MSNQKMLRGESGGKGYHIEIDVKKICKEIQTKSVKSIAFEDRISVMYNSNHNKRQ